MLRVSSKEQFQGQGAGSKRTDEQTEGRHGLAPPAISQYYHDGIVPNSIYVDTCHRIGPCKVQLEISRVLYLGTIND